MVEPPKLQCICFDTVSKYALYSERRNAIIKNDEQNKSFVSLELALELLAMLINEGVEHTHTL